MLMSFVTIHTTTEWALGSFYFLRTSDWEVCLCHFNRISAPAAMLEGQWIQTGMLKESRHMAPHQVLSI